MAEYLKTEYNTPGTTTAATSDASTAIEQRRRVSARSFLSGNVDSNSSLLQLILFCFLTGFTSAPTFLACYLWCGFQSALLFLHLDDLLLLAAPSDRVTFPCSRWTRSAVTRRRTAIRNERPDVSQARPASLDIAPRLPPRQLYRAHWRQGRAEAEMVDHDGDVHHGAVHDGGRAVCAL